MQSFNSFTKAIYESQNITGTPSSHDVLIRFLHHLSSPTGEPVNLNISEVTVYDQKSRFSDRKLTKTMGMIDKGNEELGDKTYKDVYAGFKSANHDLTHDSDHALVRKAAEARRAYESFAQSRGFKTGGNLLIENGKTKKSSGEGVHTRGISLAPHTTSGLNKFDACPRSSKECRENCLGTEAGGNRMFADAALSSKVLKTHFMLAHPDHFVHLLNGEIHKHKAEAMWTNNMLPGVRLNVTSDIPYEKHTSGLFLKHPDAQFYDYTKIHQRVMDQNKPEHPKNYHLTLSHTGTGHDENNDKHAVNALKSGHVVAMVYQRGKNLPTPHHVEDAKTGQRWRAVKGDMDDNTFDRLSSHDIPKGHGVVSALELKGVKNSDAVHFANKVDDDGVIRINKGK